MAFFEVTVFNSENFCPSVSRSDTVNIFWSQIYLFEAACFTSCGARITAFAATFSTMRLFVVLALKKSKIRSNDHETGGGTSASFGKSSLKHSKNFRIISSRNNRANKYMLLSNFSDENRGLSHFSEK